VRDAAAMLDCLSIPQPGDPFIIPKPDEPYASLAKKPPPRLKVGVVLDEVVGIPVDPEVARAVEAAGQALAGMGHAVERAKVDMGGVDVLRATFEIFFFGFDSRLDGYAKRSGHKPGPDTLEPVILSIYQAAKDITPARFIASWGAANTARRKLSTFWSKYDVWLSPTTSRVSEPWGRYNLSKPGVSWSNMIDELFRPPCQYTIPHNIMGTPAMSLPLAMHSTGVPIGVQVAAKPAADHVVLQVAAGLEAALPWRERVPTIHAAKM
jgi:amidase